MLSWQSFLSTLVVEVLNSIVCKRTLATKPFTLSESQWIVAVLHTCSRLGFVSDSTSSEKSIRRQFLSSVHQLFGPRVLQLTLDQIAQSFHCFANTSRSAEDALPRCPNALIQQAETYLIREVLRRCSGSLGATDPAAGESYAASAMVQVAPVSSSSSKKRRVSLSSRRSRSSQDFSSQVDAVVPVPGPGSIPSHSQASARTSTSNALVEFQESVGSGDCHRPLMGLPQLPPNLDDLTPTELRKFIVAHQADWLRTANKLVSVDDSLTRAKPKKKGTSNRCFQRRMAHWRKKAKRQKENFDQDMSRLVKQHELYVKNKRRKTGCFRNHLTTFAGYKLALARNVGHASCASTLSMLEADSTHRTSLTRFLESQPHHFVWWPNETV